MTDERAPVRWTPRKRSKNDTSKRRLPYHDPSVLSRKWREPTDAELITILSQMGPQFTLSDERRSILLDGATGIALVVAHTLKFMDDKPPGSELDERLAAIESAATRLYDQFEIGKTAAQAYEPAGCLGWKLTLLCSAYSAQSHTD